MQRSGADKGWMFKDTFFPEGTEFRATYKGTTYTALIKNGVWRDSEGFVLTSPSDAASKVTGTKVNGWGFWQCKRPGDSSWTRLSDVRVRQPSRRKKLDM
jgi:hypothetical protein